jgi:hypothetical protein
MSKNMYIVTHKLIYHNYQIKLDIWDIFIVKKLYFISNND